MILKRTKETERLNYRTGKTEKTTRIFYYYIKNTNSNTMYVSYYRDNDKEEMKKELENALTTGNLIKPEKTILFHMCDMEKLKKELIGYVNRGDKNTFDEINKEPEEIGLNKPVFYNNETPKKILEIGPEIDSNLFERIKKCAIAENLPFAVCGEDIEHVVKKGDYPFSPSTEILEKQWLKFYCPECGEVFFFDDQLNRFDKKCPNCGKAIPHDSNIIVDSDFKDFRKKLYNKNYMMDLSRYPSKYSDKLYYMKAVPNGVVLYKIVREVTMKKGIYHDKYFIESSIIHKVEEEIASYKHLKKEKKLCDPLAVLNINSKTISRTPHIIYEDAQNFFQFAKQNEKAMRMIGFVDVMKYSKISLKLEPFFILFLSIMNKYPVMEKIVKSGHSALFFKLYDKIQESENKEEITQSINTLEQLVNKDATKGKESLRFPPFIGDYLIRKNADLKEYCYWRDIYEISKPSKEQFEKMTSSFDFAYINANIGLHDIGNILKYGYKPEQLFSYIIKTAEKETRSMDYVITTLVDYLTMCELSDITPDLFPMNLTKQHDDMVLYFNKDKNSKFDVVLTKVAVDCERYIPQQIEDDEGNKKIGVPKLLEDYVVIFPKSENEFIQEGNMQHNCVGSYPRNVRSGNSVIFFIREKANPEKSFITGECTKKGLGQFFLSNNRYVTNQDMIALGRYISNKILSGVSSGAIRALGKIDK